MNLDCRKTPAQEFYKQEFDKSPSRVLPGILPKEAPEKVRDIDLKECAKIVRKILKQGFPSVKFSVRISRYSGGCSMSVDWTDGPTTKGVESLVCHVSGSTFDGMIDLKEYCKSRTESGELVRYECDTVKCYRKMSDSTRVFLSSRISSETGRDCAEGEHVDLCVIDGEVFRTPRGQGEGFAGALMRKLFQGMSFGLDS